MLGTVECNSESVAFLISNYCEFLVSVMVYSTFDGVILRVDDN